MSMISVLRLMKKNSIYSLAIIALCSLMALTSCVTPQDVNYLQDMRQNSQIELENRFEAVISPYDELTIYVGCFKEELAKPFNMTTLSGNGQQAPATYLVDVNGDIQFPILGDLHVAGKTRLELQDTIALCLQNDGYIDDPFVQVRFANFKIFFLGPDGGKSITIPNERCTFLEALALSGDMSLYTRRDKIAVMRQINGKVMVRYLDPRSSDVFNDPFFMLQQNDFIITRFEKSSIMQSDVQRWVPLISMGVSVISLITSLAILLTRK